MSLNTLMNCKMFKKETYMYVYILWKTDITLGLFNMLFFAVFVVN